MSAADRSTDKPMDEIEREKAQAEFEEWNSPAAKAQRQAERLKATAEADKAAAEARRAQIAALIPDLTGVERGATEVKGDAPLFGGVLAHHALGAAVKRVDDAVRRVPKAGTILVTTNKDLATGDAVYVQTTTALKHLIARATAVLGEKPSTGFEILGTGLDVVGAAASALPALLSLISANRTVQTFAASVDSLSAAIAIAGALQDNASTSVWLDDLRLVDDATVLRSAVELDRLRARLSERANDPQSPNSDAKQLLDEVTAFLTSLYASPPVARPPIVTAALYERLHQPGAQEDKTTGKPSPRFSHVLCVQGITSSTQQVVDDRPLLFDDKVSVLGTVSISWALIDTANSAVAAAGVAVGTAQMSGRIGKSFQIELVRILG